MNRASARFGVLAQPLVAAAGRIELVDRARSVIVLGCAAALVLAGHALPV